jgi:hypothetical protein
MFLAVISMLQTYLWPQRHQSLLLQSMDVLRMKKHSNNNLVCKIFTVEDGISVGNFEFVPETGEVDKLFLEPPYRHRDLEQQILIYMMKDMQDAGATHVWDAVPEDDDFYSNLWQFEYSTEKVHPTASGAGYIMPIPEDLRKILIKPGIGMY